MYSNYQREQNQSLIVIIRVWNVTTISRPYIYICQLIIANVITSVIESTLHNNTDYIYGNKVDAVL